MAAWTIPPAMLAYAGLYGERMWRYSRIPDTNRREFQTLPVLLLGIWVLVAVALGGYLLLRRSKTARP